MTLNAAATKFFNIQRLTFGVDCLTVDTIMQCTTGGEKDACVGKWKTICSKDGHKRTILRVLTNKTTFILRVNARDDG